jgi:hypothetical protein
VFEINVYPTHISVSNAKEASIKLGKLLELFEYEDEYAPIINETHDEFGEYYEPDYDEAIRQENTRKL